MGKDFEDGIYLAWVAITDLDKAIAFYTKTLGMQLKEKHDEFGWAELSGKGGARLGLAVSTPKCQQENTPAPGSNAILTYAVADIAAAKASMLQQGAKMIGDIQEIAGHVKLQLFADPDGNQLQLVECLFPV